MLENSVVRWVIAVALAFALVGLLAYARGAEDGVRRSPDEGHLGAPALVRQAA